MTGFLAVFVGGSLKAAMKVAMKVAMKFYRVSVRSALHRLTNYP